MMCNKLLEDTISWLVRCVWTHTRMCLVFFNKVEAGYKKSDQIIEAKEGGLQSEYEILKKQRIKWKILLALKMCGRVPMFLVCLTSPKNLKPPSEGQKNNNCVCLHFSIWAFVCVFVWVCVEFISVFSWVCPKAFDKTMTGLWSFSFPHPALCHDPTFLSLSGSTTCLLSLVLSPWAFPEPFVHPHFSLYPFLCHG